MEIVVIDGQGGGIGKSIVQTLKARIPDAFVIGIGTNSTATNNIKKGGADAIATGENAIVYNVTKAAIIAGPIGICFANSMYGEISPTMAGAISASEGAKYLVPVSKCSATVVGVPSMTIQEYVDVLVDTIIEQHT